tara:strand:- start:233413 stop:233619 length:207 start_codon:yes stop_codon:yes gene_type:complete
MLLKNIVISFQFQTSPLRAIYIPEKFSSFGSIFDLMDKMESIDGVSTQFVAILRFFDSSSGETLDLNS